MRDVQATFEKDTADHRLEIIRDDGLYRHLRCAKPGTYVYGYDIVTWPGYLAYVGDMGDYVFMRVRDMFDFFESDSGRINPDYWAQKLQAPRGTLGAKEYSERRLRQYLDEWCEDQAYEDGGYPHLWRDALERDYLSVRELHYEENAREMLAELEGNGVLWETWEWDLKDFEFRFIWCCHAIVKAITVYRRSTERLPLPVSS